MALVRWFMLVPVTLLAWFAVVCATGLLLHRIELFLCPPEDLFSGACYNESVGRTMVVIRNVLIHVAIGLSAIAVLVTAFLIAPEGKESVVWLTLLIGSLFAIAFAAPSPLKALSHLAAAEIPALLTTLLLVRIARNADAAQPSPSRVNPTGR